MCSMCNATRDFVDRFSARSFFSVRSVCVDIHLFAFPFRPNAGVPSPPSEPMESSSATVQPIKTSVPLNRQSSDELNAQQGKRKFSLSQYKERKRLKSNELPQDSLADTDMRINNAGQSKVRIEDVFFCRQKSLAADS